MAFEVTEVFDPNALRTVANTLWARQRRTRSSKCADSSDIARGTASAYRGQQANDRYPEGASLFWRDLHRRKTCFQDVPSRENHGAHARNRVGRSTALAAFVGMVLAECQEELRQQN